MKHYSSVIDINTNNHNISNNNSFSLKLNSARINKHINNKHIKESSKIMKIINSLKNKNFFLKTLKKRKKLSEQYVPKNKKINNYLYKEQNENMNQINIDNNNTIPLKDKVLYIQKKIEKNSFIIKSLSEENKLFNKNYKLAFLLQQKNKNKKKFFPLKENTNNQNNIFTRSILLSDNDINKDITLREININECKEDLKIIEKLKKYNKDINNNIENSFFILNKINIPEKKKEDINQIKKQIEDTKKTISDLEKNNYNFDFDDLNLDKNRKKSLEILQNKIRKININNKQNGRKYLTLNPPNASGSLLDNKGSYKLVTKCDINSYNYKKNLINHKRILQKNKTHFEIIDFYNQYNRVKKMLGPTSKSKTSSAAFVLNMKKERKKKLIDIFNFNSDEKSYYNELNLSLDSNVKNKNFDINNLYTYMKYNKYDKASKLFDSYIKKYNRKYVLNNNIYENGIKLYPMMYDIKQNSIKYNISNKMRVLNNSKYIDLNLFKNQKRKKIIHKIKKFDERMKDIGYESIESILDLNQDLIF